MTCNNFQCYFTAKYKLWDPEKSEALGECKLRLFFAVTLRLSGTLLDAIPP